MTLPIVRDCVVRFNAERPGRAHRPQSAAPKLGATDRCELLQMVEHGPMPAIHGAVRWRRVDLAQWIWEEFRISVSTQTLSRERRMWREINPGP